MTDEEQERSSAPAADPSRVSTWTRPPSWLRVPPTARGVPAPIQTRPQLLPVGDLAWEDFERLCLRLLELDAEPIHVSATGLSGETTMPVAGLYGRPGQAQFGIDVYARDPLVYSEPLPPRKYVSLQARRIKTVTEAQLSSSVDRFLEGQWGDVSRKFIYATSDSTRSTQLVDEIEKLTARLAQQSIEFAVWDQEEISKRLKSRPELVDDFFGRHWVEEFCGDTAAKTLGTRLDAQQVADLRRELTRIYTASFGVADSGLIAFRFGPTPNVGLMDRFVTPDLISTTPQTVSLPQPVDDLSELGMEDYDRQAFFAEAAERNALPDEGIWFFRNSARNQRRMENPHVVDRRPADQWLGTERLQVIVGDPGAGKSTLLRFLILDLLSEEPQWRSVAERWGQCLPVWLPFHFFTQRVAGQTGAPASVGEALKAWLEQHDAGQVWPLVEAALNDQRLLLIVDGLDEWVDDEAGRYAATALETFAASRSTPLVVSARPYGLTRLMLGVGWSYKRIAPLTEDQQRLLALHYFQAVVDAEDRPSSLAVIERSVDDFLSQVRNAPDLRAISGTPLFLVLLVGLRLSNVTQLPTERFEVYNRAVQLLVADHPAKRRAAAAVTAQRTRLSDSQLRVLLANVAFVSQSRGDVSTVQDAVLRQDFIQALSDANHLAMNATDAANTADQLLDVAEGELGILVRKGPGELGFLHRILQEQLAAEYISDRLNPDAINGLFAEHVRDPRWREVLLATMWRLSRPSELSDLMAVIRNHIDESPAGLRTREILAEVTFGPYGLPATDIQQSAPEVIEVIETHPYGPHRARLLDSVLTGLEGAAAGDIARECLERWTLLIQGPSDELVWEIAQLPSVESLSETICKLLVMAIRNPASWIAYAGASAIANRCSSAGPGNDEERDLLRIELLNILSNPPSGLAQAAALTALTLEWRDDPLVIDILNEARGHSEDSVRIVVLSDVLGVLRTTFSLAPSEVQENIQQLSDVEREWLVGRLGSHSSMDVHSELLAAAISEAVREQHSVLVDWLESLQSEAEPYISSDLIWPIVLNVFADDERVVDIVCDQLRRGERSSLNQAIMTYRDQPLVLPYPPESPHHGRVATAVEDWLRSFKTPDSALELYRLAAVDRGPVMKGSLLDELAASSNPHWAAEALVEYFVDDAEVRNSLHSMLMGNPQQASRIANVATRVLPPNEVIPRLLEILRCLAGAADPTLGRYDFVASALLRACQKQGISQGPEFESIAAEALQPVRIIHLPLRIDPHFFIDPRHHLAAAFYPSTASKTSLAELAKEEERPIEPYLRAFRHDPEQVKPFLIDASKMLCSLPESLRGQICQFLADRATSPDLVLRLTHRWADERSSLNKSIASLAYHRALLRAKEEGQIDHGQWDLALVNLGDQASSYGFDRGARRRSAWVGMCVCGDWSMLEGRVETIGEASPVSVPLVDMLYGQDRTSLQQIASRWKELRSEFGDTLLTRLSGIEGQEPRSEVWDALALVAGQDATLQQELESAVADDPELLKWNGILVWFVTRRSVSKDAIADALISHLQNDGAHLEIPVSILLAASSRNDLQRKELLSRLEDALPGGHENLGSPALEAIAVLFPEHPLVRHAWQEISALITDSSGSTERHIRAQTYFAVVYAAADSSEILGQIEGHLVRFEESGTTYYDNLFAHYVSHRLRHDDVATGMVQDAVLDPTTPDSRVAQLVALLADAVGLDEIILREIEGRIAAQNEVRLAPVVRDHAISASLSVRTMFTRIADAALDVRST